MPLEKQKASIIDALETMHSNMREYTMDVEDKLEKAYATMGGKQKKFVYEQSQDYKIDEINSQAEEFLKSLPPRPKPPRAGSRAKTARVRQI